MPSAHLSSRTRGLLALLALGLGGCSGQATGLPIPGDDAGLELTDAGPSDAGLVDAGPALVLDGGVWWPNRSSDGLVLDTDFSQLPSNRWILLGGPSNTLQGVAELPPYPTGYGSDGFHNIVAAWGGAAWDALNERMLISGGGHSDSSAAETEVLALDTRRMTISLAMPRQPLDSPLLLDATSNTLVKGDAFPGGYNFPLSTGVPGATHTYDSLLWLPPALMAELGSPAPTSGGFVYSGNARAVLNLDTRTYSPLFWKSLKTAYWDISYLTAVRWKKHLIYPASTFYFHRWDLGQTELTDWQGPMAGGFNPNPTVPALGKDLAGRTSSAPFVAGSRTFVNLAEPGMMVSFAATHRRVRYGAAEDQDAADWTAFSDEVTLTGPDAADLNTPASYKDEGTNLLNHAGASFEPVSGDVYVCPNLKGSRVYRVSGLSAGPQGTVVAIPGSETLTSSTNGTFGRFVVFVRGTTTLAVRVTSTSTPVEIIRLAP